MYERPIAYPAWLDAVQADGAASLARPTVGADIRDQVVQLLGSANLADKSWITNQYDKYVLGNTAFDENCDNTQKFISFYVTDPAAPENGDWVFKEQQDFGGS